MHCHAMFVKLPSGVRLARMSSGTWCLVRDLGLVKGGKGMRSFEPVMTFSFRALRKGIREWTRKKELAASVGEAPADATVLDQDFSGGSAEATYAGEPIGVVDRAGSATSGSQVDDQEDQTDQDGDRCRAESL